MFQFIAKTFGITVMLLLIFMAATYLPMLFVTKKIETAELPEALVQSRQLSPQDAPYAQFTIESQQLCGRVKLGEDQSFVIFAKCIARQTRRIFCAGQDSKEFAMLVSAIVAKTELGIGQKLYFSEKPTLHQKQLSEQFLQDRKTDYWHVLTATERLVERGDLNAKDFARIAHADIQTIMVNVPRHAESCYRPTAENNEASKT